PSADACTQPGCVVMQAVRCAVCQLVQDYFLIQIAIAVGRRTRPHEHLAARQRTIGRRAQNGVVWAGKILGLGSAKVFAKTAALEVVLLEVSRRLRKAQLIYKVVITIRPEEQVCDRAHSVVWIAWRIGPTRGRIVGKVKNSERRARGSSGRVDSIR